MITVCVISTMLIMVRSTRTLHAELRLITVTKKYDGEARPALRKPPNGHFPEKNPVSRYAERIRVSLGFQSL